MRLVLIFPREYTTYIVMSKLKIFSCAPPTENLHCHWMLLVLARYRELWHILMRSVRRTFLPLQK